jgi:hypothetical protein
MSGATASLLHVNSRLGDEQYPSKVTTRPLEPGEVVRMTIHLEMYIRDIARMPTVSNLATLASVIIGSTTECSCTRPF